MLSVAASFSTGNQIFSHDNDFVLYLADNKSRSINKTLQKKQYNQLYLCNN